MRIDKFLKISRIIKRRTIANEVCDKGKVLINGKIAKAGSGVKEGDIIRLEIGEKPIEFEILCVDEKAMKQDCKNMYKTLDV